MMKKYQEAYETYLNICSMYGMESINYYRFIKNLTEDQIEQYSKLAI